MHFQAHNQAEWAPILAVAAGIISLHLATSSRYGFYPDELQFLSDARHLDWGFVSYPPFTPFIERIALHFFGLSLVGLRLFSALGQADAIVLTGLMAKELGGGKLAQLAAALAIALSPMPLYHGAQFQYTSFDYVWWVVIAYLTIRLLKSQNPHWWWAVGAAAGFGLMTKYTICFLIVGLFIGFLLSPARRLLLAWQFVGGVLIAFFIFLPNLLWQLRHDFITYHFLQFIHARDVGQQDANGFWIKQFFVCANLFAAPLWIAGLWCYLRSTRYRPLAFMYLFPMILLVFSKGKYYYLAASYPMLIAMGASATEHWVAQISPLWRRATLTVFLTGIVGYGSFIAVIVLPFAAAGALKHFTLNNGIDTSLRNEIGWNDLVSTVAGIRDNLPTAQQASSGVVTGNYGEQGAVEILGPAYHLPAPISTINSSWLRGYPSPQPTTLIVIGFSHADVDQAFTACRLAGHDGNSEGVVNSESRLYPDIFVCGGPRKSWPEFWREHQRFE